MRLAVLTALALAGASPAAAAVSVVARNVDFSAARFTFGVTPTDTFTFTYDPRGSFDFDPVLISTSGTAQVQVVFGAPSVSFADRDVVFGPNSFPGFGSVPTPTRAGATLTASEIGLRYAVGSDFYYGVARFAGPQIDAVLFETTPNTGIQYAAVPEPATWALLIGGIGAVGGSLRARRRARVTFA